MKKIIIAFFVALAAFFSIVLPIGLLSKTDDSDFKVAMVTDFSDVNDASFNQLCYEGGKEWGKANNITFNYYKPTGLSNAERIKAITLAIDRGYDVILCPGFAFGETLAEVAPKFPDTKFIGIDISESDFPKGFVIPDNVAIYNYHEEIAGYLAGYAAVKEGFVNLGYLGGMEAAAVIRFGYGYVQGVDTAATELQRKVKLQYVYGGQFFGDSDINIYMDNWYKTGTEIVFSCGGSIYTSVALAAKENGGYMIGVDTNQAPIIDRDYKEGICITSAMKGIKQTVIDKLDEYYHDNSSWESGFNYLGLISSEHPEDNFVQLPLEDWRMKNFSVEDYKALIKDIMDGKKVISSDTSEEPKVNEEYTNFIPQGSIK